MSYELMKKETASEISNSGAWMEAVVELAQLHQFAKTIKVTNDAQKAVAAEARARIHTRIKELEEMRLSAGVPYREMLKTINNIFYPYVYKNKGENDSQEDGKGPAALKLIDSEYLPYEKEQEFIIAEEQKRAMAAQIEASNVTETEAKAKMMTPSNVIDTDSGKTIVQDDITVEIVNDIKLIKAVLDGRNTLPLDLISINEVKLKQLCRGSMYSAKKWAKYGVKVVRTRKVQSRT